MSQFHPLIISDISETTPDAIAMTFAVPEYLRETYAFKPGQYLTLRFNIDGEDLRRSYSICSSPLESHSLRIGVKRVQDGKVSNYIPETLNVGDSVEVMPPNGLFFADINADNYKTYYLFACGSGITPVLSILKTVLEVEPHSYVYMLYGNQHQNSIMFLNEIQEIYDRYPKRFFLKHYLSRPKGGLSSLFSQTNNLDYQTGRVDTDAIRNFLNQYQPYAQDVEYYICGPEKMIDSTVQTLQSIDVPDQRIFVERFNATAEAGSERGIAGNLTAKLNGETVQVAIKAGQTLLRGLIEAGYNPPYSCEGGVCSTCRCRLIKGKVEMKSNLALSHDQVAKGSILSCQSLPLTTTIEIEYTEFDSG